MPNAVFTRRLRFQFVRGWLTGGTDPGDGSVECGDDTQFCMEITGTPHEKADQLAEIYYRVRAFKTEGEITFTVNYTDGGGTSHEFTRRQYFDGTEPAEVAVGEGGGSAGDYFILPGLFTTRLRSATPADQEPMVHSPFFGDPLDPDLIITPFDDVIARMAISEIAAWELDPLSADPRNGYFENAFTLPQTNISTYGALYTIEDTEFVEFRSGFTFYGLGELFLPPQTGNFSHAEDTLDGSPDPGSEDGTTVIQFGPEVAFIDADGSGNPFSTGNRLFVRFYLCSSASAVPTSSWVSSFKDTEDGSTALGWQEVADMNFRVVLKSGEPTAKVYAFIPDFVSGMSGFTVAGTVVDEVVQDITLTPYKWWPYAKGIPAGPVWDTATGDKV